MTAPREAGADVDGDRFLHLHVTSIEGVFGKPRLLKGGLHIHAEIHNVGDKLCMA